MSNRSTKRGTGEVPSINFSAETGIQDFTRLLSPVNSYDFARLRNQARVNDGLDPAYTDFDLERYRTGDDPTRYPNTNWRDMNLKKYSIQQRYNLNVSGASKNMSYFVNAGYLEKQNSPYGVFGALPGDRNTNLANQSPSLYILASIFSLPANVPGPLTPDGQVITSPLEANPVFGQINRTGYIQQTRSNVIASYGMEHALDFITKGLSAKAVVSFDTRTTNNLFAGKSYQKFTQVIDPNIKGSDGRDSIYYKQYNNDQNTPLSLGGGQAFNTLHNIQGYLNYNRTFANDHTFTGLYSTSSKSRLSTPNCPTTCGVYRPA